MLSVLADPDFHTSPNWTRTLGPEVADLCEMIGFAPYPEQRLILDDLFALDAKIAGRSASFESAVIACRQQMKTGLIKQAALGWLFVTDQRLVIWSAHEFGTAQEAFRDMQALVDGSDMLSRRVKKITTGNGDEAIELMSGARLRFKARTSGGGRGLTGNKVILDEAFALKPEHMGALLPTLISVDDPQVLYGSSAGLATSDILRALRDRGRAGGERLSYAEWLAERRECGILQCGHEVGTPGCALDDVTLWAKACPVSYRRDPDLDAIRALRNAMPAEEFMRECLGWWDDPHGETVIPIESWADCMDLDSKIADRPEFVLDVAPKRGSAAIAVGGKRSDGMPHVEITGRGGSLDHRPGVDWVIPRLRQMRDSSGLRRVWIMAGSAAESMVPAITSEGIGVDVVKTSDIAPACGLIYDLSVSKGFRHMGQDVVTTALKGASRVDVGDGAWKFTRRKSSTDITPFYALVTALWVCSQKRKTPNVW